MSSNEDITKAGYLTKQGAVNKGWKRRWFVLQGNVLLYYAKEGDVAKKALGEIDLDEATSVSVSDNSGRKHVFEIVLPNRTFFLSADSREIMDGWMQQLKDTMKNAGSTADVIKRVKRMSAQLSGGGGRVRGRSKSKGFSERRTARTKYTPEQLWPLYVEPARWSEWDPDIKSAKLLSDEFENGSEVEVVMTDGKEFKTELTKVVPGHQFTYIANIPGSKMVCTFVLYELEALIQASDEDPSVTLRFGKDLDTSNGAYHTLIWHEFAFTGSIGSLYGKTLQKTVTDGLEHGLENILKLAEKEVGESGNSSSSSSTSSSSSSNSK